MKWWEQQGYDTEGEAVRDGAKPKIIVNGVEYDPLNLPTEAPLSAIFSTVEFGPSMPSEISDKDLKELNRLFEYEIAMSAGMNPDEYKELLAELLIKHKKEMQDNPTLAGKFGSWAAYLGTTIGLDVKSAWELTKLGLANNFEDIVDVLRPEPNGFLDNFAAGFTGEIGTTPVTDAINNILPDAKYDYVNDRWYNAITDKTVEESSTNSETEVEEITPTDTTTATTTTPTVTTAPTGQAFNAIGQRGPRGESNEGYEYKFDNPPGRGFNPGVANIGDPDPEPLERSQEIDRRTIIIYKDGESKRVDFRSLQSFLDNGWSTTKPEEEEEVVVEDEQVIDDDTGTGQLVSDQLNEFNNIPKNAVLIDAGGELFLGYEVPGAYGQLYNGNPIYMLYEVLSNDVFEAGILTQGASPQVNVSLGSKQDLNQYGIVVGGTDELTDDVEHPFIRFVENFEAGKRVNPWLADTEINPNTGVTYQQEAIEFLAEQALEQFTPEQTQVRYEGSDWYQKSTTAQKTWLTTLLTQPAQAEQDIQDKQIQVKIAMEANGIASPPDALVNWVADKAVTGMWTQVYTDQQIALLADPYKPGTRDTGMVNFIEGVGVGTLDRLSVGEKTVRDLYRRYLGPSLGSASDTEIAEKAGLLRSDPDAEEQLKAYLEQQRLAMFGNYTNPTLTYNDIVQPYKNLVNQVWGQEVDETQDWFIKMVQDNDIEKAYTTLREKGMEQGIERVQDQALNDLQRSIGQGQIAPQLGANT